LVSTKDERLVFPPEIAATLVAGGCTAISLAIANAAFLPVAINFWRWHDGAAGFAFRPIGSDMVVSVAICVLLGANAIFTKRWIVPFVVGAVLFVILYPLTYQLKWSGSAEHLAVALALLDVRRPLYGCSVLINALLVIFCCRHKPRHAGR